MSNEAQGKLGYESLRDFSERLGLNFPDPLLLTRALTHRSFLNEHPEALEDNERLEFLGDAVLDFLVGAWLYNRFPEMSEGNLTRLRSALVRTESLAEFARQIDLGSVLLLGHGESEGGGRDRIALLCGAFEALIGAIYLEGGYHPSRTLWIRCWKSLLIRSCLPIRIEILRARCKNGLNLRGTEPPITVRSILTAPTMPRYSRWRFLLEIRVSGMASVRASNQLQRLRLMRLSDHSDWSIN